MKLAIVQQASGIYVPMLSRMIPWHLSYAQRHSLIYLPSFGRIVDNRHENWSRFPLLIETLRAGFADIVVWLDADCVIADADTSLLEAADEFLYLGATLHREPWGSDNFHFNMGAMYLRNTPFTVQFLEEVHRSGKIEGEKWENQGTMFNIAKRMSFSMCRMRNKWNSTPAINDCHKPVVRSYHGTGLDKLAETTARMAEIADANLRASAS